MTDLIFKDKIDQRDWYESYLDKYYMDDEYSIKPTGQQILDLCNNSLKKSPRSIWKRWKKRNSPC